MKITAQTEVNPNTFMMQSENGQPSMDFFFILFLQLIQTTMDILNPSEEPHSNIDGMSSQDARFNSKRALNFIEENPSLKETFNQAITFIALISQFVSNKEVNYQDASLSIKFDNINNVEIMKLNLVNPSSKDQKFSLNSEDLFLNNQASSITNEKSVKPLLLSSNILQNLSTFISKSWKEFKALLKETKEQINVNSQYIKNEFFLRVDAYWEDLPEQEKAYLKDALSNLFFNQNKRNANAFPNQKNPLNSNGVDKTLDMSAQKKTNGVEVLEVNNNKRNETPGNNMHNNIHGMLKEGKNLGDAGHHEVKTILTNVLEGEKEPKEIRSFLKELIEKFNSKGSERGNFFVPPTRTEESPFNIAMHSSPNAQAHSSSAPKVILRELPDFVRNLVFEVQPQGEQKARIELFPPELGHVDIEVRVEKGEVSVIGKVENPQAYQDILREAPVIKTHLEELGLKVKELVFTLTSGDANLPYHGDGQSKENRDRLSVKNDGRLLTKGLPKEETLINSKGRYYYIV